jgi:hypothetical protein
MARWGTITITALVAGFTLVCATVAHFYVGLGCALNQNIQPGSEADRFCESGLIGAPTVVAAVLIPLAGGAIAHRLRRPEPLVIAGFVAAFAAFGPAAASGGLSTDAPEKETVVEPAPPAPVVARPDPEGAPHAAGPGQPPVFSEADRAVLSAQSEATQVSNTVADCLASSAYPERCAPYALAEHTPSAEIRVKIRSRTRWRITARTRLAPSHAYAMDVRRRGRGAVDTVHTCSPPGTRVCTEPGRKVERIRYR